MVRPERFELPTYCSGGNRSIHLSYGRTPVLVYMHSLAPTIGRATPAAVRYQRFRPPPPPPPPRPPRSPPRSLPPPPLRSVLGRASFTFSVRPPIWEPFKAAIALSPSSAFAISTKPKPRERPVSRSVKMVMRSTCPCGSKSLRNSSSEVLKSRLPTKMFFKRHSSCPANYLIVGFRRDKKRSWPERRS